MEDLSIFENFKENLNKLEHVYNGFIFKIIELANSIVDKINKVTFTIIINLEFITKK